MDELVVYSLPPLLLNLPLEIIESIVTHEDLSIVDLCRLSATCSTIRSIIERSWKKIVLNKWCWWSEECLSSVTSDRSWYRLCRERYCCDKYLQVLLRPTISRGVRQYLTDDEELESYGELVATDATAGVSCTSTTGTSSSTDTNMRGCCSQSVLECVLTEILSKGIREGNLSHQYYGLCILEYVRRTQLKEKWKEFLSKDNQLLIEGATLIAQWINPLECSSIKNTVTREITTIVQSTVTRLLTTSCDQEAVTMVTTDDEYDQDGLDLIRGKFSRDEILTTLNQVMFNTLGYRPAMDDYYKLDNSLIDKVIDRRRGIPITLSAVYQAAANRLGVKLLPVNFPAHFLLKSEVNHLTGNGEVFIDPFNRGEFLSQSECLNLIPFLSVTSSTDVFKAVPTHKAVMRMVTNIYQRDPFSLNFDVGRHWVDNKWSPLVLPASISLQLFLCGICTVCDFTSTVAAGAAEIALDLKYNTKQVTWVMSDICTETSPSVYVLTKLQRAQFAAEKKKKTLNEPTRVKHRDPNTVLYCVGTIMEHVRYNYKCVVYGWDSTCEMTEQWIQQMGVNQLPLGPTQPFYNVLVEDGTNRYAAQENLSPCAKDKIAPIYHWEVGKYFYKFTGEKYLANHALLEKYPD